MKKYILYLFFLTVAFSSCKENTTEPIIGNVDERLSLKLKEYQNLLADSEFGWKGYLLSNSEKTSTFIFKFNDKNRIIMSADYKNEPIESSYRLKSLQRPTLLFDTYSTLHLLNDPSPNVFGGATGKGYFSDFEFAFLSATKDTIKLEGTFNQSKLILIRSKSNEENTSAFKEIQNLSNTFSQLQTYFIRTRIGQVDCEIKIDSKNQIFTFKYLEDEIVKSISSNYFVSDNTIVFYTPLIIGSTTISNFKNLTYNSTTSTISAIINGNDEIQFREDIVPLKYDVNAGNNFITWATAIGYASSDLGFHVDGVDDAFNLRDLSNYLGIDFQPKSSNPPYSYFRISSNAVSYGPAIIPIVTAEGTIIFPDSGLIINTLPEVARAKYLQILDRLFQEQGYYLIQTNGGNNSSITYDMVNVLDAKTWISWRY